MSKESMSEYDRQKVYDALIAAGFVARQVNHWGSLGVRVELPTGSRYFWNAREVEERLLGR